MHNKKTKFFSLEGWFQEMELILIKCNAIFFKIQ